MQREPQNPRERAVLLLRAALLPGWHPTPGQRLVWATRGAIALGGLLLLYFIVNSIVHRSLWAWLDLLIVPAVLAIGGYLFARSENRATRAAAERRAQDEALEAYLDQMSQLLLDKDTLLRQSKGDDEARTLARARTLTVLRRLDGERKGRVMQFLYEAGLINRDSSLVNLEKAGLRGADLIGSHLSRADLRVASLYGANLSGITDLSEADLSNANLGVANLSDADLSDADLLGAMGWTEEQLRAAKSLDGATMPHGQKHEDWIKSREENEE